MTFIYNTNVITEGLDLLICVWEGIHVCVHACSCVRGAPGSVSCSHSLLYILKQNLLLNLELAVPASMLQVLPRAPAFLLELQLSYHSLPACVWILGGLSSSPHSHTGSSFTR